MNVNVQSVELSRLFSLMDGIQARSVPTAPAAIQRAAESVHS